MSVPFSNTHLRVPRGFSNILEALAREVLRDQPKDIPTYAAKYFESLLKEREESGMDHAQWGAKLEDRFYNNHAFKIAGPTEDITAVTSSSADDLIESQTEDETDTTLPSGTTSGEMQGLDSEVRDDKEDSSNKDVTSTEAAFSRDDTDCRLTAAEESTDEVSEAEQTSGPDDVTAENNDGRAADNEMLESQLEPTELASYRGVADVDVCAEELRETEKHVDGAPTSQCSTQDNQAAEVEGTGSSGGEKERRDGDRIEKVIFTEPSAVDTEEPSISGEDGAPAGVIENVPTDETGTEVPVEHSSPQMIEASQDPKQIPDFSGEEESESKTAVEEGTGVIPAAGIDTLCENEDLLNTAPDPEEVAIVSEHVEQGLPTEKQADEEEALTETSLTQVSEEKLHTFSLQAKHHGGFDTERWDEDLQADRAAEEVTADTGAVEVTAQLEMEPESNDDEDGENETKDQRKVESSTLHQLTNETEEIELWDDGDDEKKDEAEHSSTTDYAAAIEQGGPEDLVNVHMDTDDDAAENNMDNFEKDSFNTQPQDDTETERGNVAHIDADDDDGEQKELKTELEKEEEEEEEEGQTAMEVNEEVPAEGQEREQTPVVEKAEEQTMEEEAGSKLEEKYFSQAGEAHTVEEEEEEEEEDQQEGTNKAALEGDETVTSFGSVEQPGDDDSGEKDRPESKMEDVKEESSQPQEEEDIMDIPLDDPEANKAAAKIQAGFRGHMTRKKMKPEDKEGEEDEGAEEVSSTGDALNGGQGEPAEPGGRGSVGNDTTVPEQ